MPDGVTRVLLTRHGQTVANVEGRFCGHSETELTARGRAQAMALGRRLAGEVLAACYSSDLSRAVETALLALGERGIGPVPLPALRERHYGAWEMELETEVQRRDPLRFAQMEAEDPAWVPPGGESLAAVRERASAALREIAARHTGETVLVVAHGTMLNCLVAGLLGLPETHVFRFEVGHCTLFEVEERRGRFVVARMNDSAHLDGLA
ncbi:MAG: alpha-ribazole phosphatase [Tepidiforma sp.]|nr:MAG: alpha-ribazole phosphatase [Tepidiforma sp.]